MGWLGWTPEVALATDVNLVELAVAGRSDLLKMVFGDGSPPDKRPGKVTPERFKAFVERHNAARERNEDG